MISDRYVFEYNREYVKSVESKFHDPEIVERVVNENSWFAGDWGNDIEYCIDRAYVISDCPPSDWQKMEQEGKGKIKEVEVTIRIKDEI